MTVKTKIGRIRDLLTIVLLLSATAMVGFTLVSRRSPPSPVDRVPIPLTGKYFPDFQVESTDGQSVQLSSVLGSDPTVLVLVDLHDCLGCGDYATEAQIITREYPQVQYVMIGVGEGEGMFKEYFRRNRLRGFLDTSSKIPSRLGEIEPPLVLFLAADRRVLLTDRRPGPQFQRYPISRMLADVKQSLGDPHS